MRATWMGVKWCAASLERALLLETWGQTGRSPGFRRCKGRKRGTTNLRIAEAATVAGAPFFAHVAKGGYRTATEWFWLEGLKQAGLEPVLSAASYPPLQKTQGRGTRQRSQLSYFRFPSSGDFDVMQKRRVIIPFASVCIPAAQARSRFLLVRFAHVSE
jgi:hypothetical protein